jgi:uncharacterized protein (TIGR03083 family)
MSIPAYPELVIGVRREGEAILAAAELGLDAEVPTCEGWDVRELVRHVSRIYLRVAALVASRTTEVPDQRPELPDGEPTEVMRDALDRLVGALCDVKPESPAWNWSGTSQTAHFWARRMAHESSIHRFDAESAHDVRMPLDPELAGDELDELLDVLGPRIYERDNVSGPTGTVALRSSDNGEWYLELGSDGLRRIEVVKEPDVTASGTTSALVLACYSRVPWTSLEVTGHAALLERWTTAMNF